MENIINNMNNNNNANKIKKNMSSYWKRDPAVFSQQINIQLS